jgi:hypothetical protein
MAPTLIDSFRKRHSKRDGIGLHYWAQSGYH